MSTIVTAIASGATSAPARRTIRRALALSGAPAAASTTYYYRTAGGSRASTTDAGSIPAGAVVERVT